MAQPAALPAAPPPRLARPGSANGAMEATGVLPFVRGVDLSGNDFKVSRPGGGAGLSSRLFLPLRPAPVSASWPARLRAQCHSGLQTGLGGALPGLESPASNESSRPPPSALMGRLGRRGRVGSKSRQGVGREPPPHVPVLGSWPRPDRRVERESWSTAAVPAAPLPRPAEVTRPSQALTHYRAAGCLGAGLWLIAATALPAPSCVVLGKSLPLSEPLSSHPVQEVKNSPLGSMD